MALKRQKPRPGRDHCYNEDCGINVRTGERKFATTFIHYGKESCYVCRSCATWFARMGWRIDRRKKVRAS